jgi:hypothetical protein
MLPAKADGGPGILFWTYYERSPNGGIDERVIAFQGVPLKVSSVPAILTPEKFLSLERRGDVGEIFRYNAQHGL